MPPKKASPFPLDWIRTPPSPRGSTIYLGECGLKGILDAMLGTRASRITDAASSGAAAKQQARPLRRELSPWEGPARIRRWAIVTRKLIMVLYSFHYKNSVMAALGERAYKTIFGTLRQNQITDAAEKKMTVNKILDGQIMGKELPMSKTEKVSVPGASRQDPRLCQHPP